jgi:RNA polymerase sigma-70 factor (ECF subfamily)
MKARTSLLMKTDFNDEKLEKIIKKAKNEHADALDQLSRYVYSRLYSYVFYRVNHREDAEDLTSEVVLKVIRNLRNQHGNFNAWIYKIAKNAVIDFYRRRAVRPETSLSTLPGEIPDTTPLISEYIMTQEKLRQGLQKLTEDQRQVIIMKFIDGYSNPEIAQFMHKSVGAIKLLQYRALQSLRKYYRKKCHETK